MLATQLLPAASPFGTSHPDDAAQYRPVKDIEAFNALLPPPIEFVEGSSSGTLSLAEDKYEPINGSPKLGATPKANKSDSLSTADIPKTPSTPKTPNGKSKELFTGELDLTWPPGSTVGAGLHNTGNTCFLNSALQCLIHTPPLAQVVMEHGTPGGETCRGRNNCMTCHLRNVLVQSRSRKSAFVPAAINNRLQAIAKHMRRGRQEDSHEFLRYFIDALQKSSLAGYSPKLDPKIAETTWVHKIFGGRLRSRVTCRDCGYHSDTFDRVLDLSIDIHGANDLREAMKGFVNVDVLKGADKYKCEKCKKAVVAEKRFTIHEAPLVLTIHLKRFSPLGRKIGHPIRYDERLRLQPYMSDGQQGPAYTLYGVISHAGGGPNSGHYYAHVRAGDGRWYEMNDESVGRIASGAPLGLRSAYVLFYIRSDREGPSKVQQPQSPGQGLQPSPVINARPSTLGAAASMIPRVVSRPGGIVAGMKRRNEDGAGGDERNTKTARTIGSPTSPIAKKKQIGPLLPSGTFVSEKTSASAATMTKTDPQAALLRKKISSASALQQLSQYNDPSSDNDAGEASPHSPETGVDESGARASRKSAASVSAEPDGAVKDQDQDQAQAERSTRTSSAAPVPANSFYGSGKNSDVDVPTRAETAPVTERGGDTRGDNDHHDGTAGDKNDNLGDGGGGGDAQGPDGDPFEGEDGSWLKVRKGGPSSATPAKLGIRPRPAGNSKQEKWKRKLFGKGKHRHKISTGGSPWDGRKGDNLRERRDDVGSPAGMWKSKRKFK